MIVFLIILTSHLRQRAPPEHRHQPVDLNRAVALSRIADPEAVLPDVTILARGVLEDYQPAHAALADLLRRAGRPEEAREAYRRALERTASDPDRR